VAADLDAVVVRRGGTVTLAVAPDRATAERLAGTITP
jgi:hypothetical protein